MKKEIQKKKTMHKKLNIAINSMIGAVSIMGSAALGIGLTQCSKPNPPPTPPTPVVLNILSPENNPKDWATCFGSQTTGNMTGFITGGDTFFNNSSYDGIDFSSFSSISFMAFADLQINSSFSNPNKSITITFENSTNATSIGMMAFIGCTSITNVVLPNADFSIGAQAFQLCINLKQLSLPSDSEDTQITAINDYAFAECENLSVDGIIALGAKITNNLYFAQNGVSGAAIVSAQNQKWIIGAGLVAGDIGSSLDFYFFDFMIKPFDDYGFYACKSLTSITLPNTAFNIGDLTFWNCTNLKSLSLPKNSENTEISSIGSSTFYGCENLSVSGIIALGNKIDTSNLDFVQNGTSGAAIVSRVTTSWINTGGILVAGDIGASFNIYYDVIFPTSSSTTAGRTFSGCASLISITLPNATFGITNSIFRECTNLKTLSLPSDSTNTQINSIDSYAFEHCESLSVSGIIALGNKIDTSNLDFVQNGTSGAAIFRKDNFSSPSSGHNALLAGNVGTSLNSYFTDTIKNFYNLASLTGVDLGTFSIDGNAFNGCTKLNTLYWHGDSVPTFLPSESGWFLSCAANGELHVTQGYDTSIDINNWHLPAGWTYVVDVT